MNAHITVTPTLAHGAILPARQARHLGAQPGLLTVVNGTVWLSRKDDLDDHVLHSGQQFQICAGDDAVIEPWHAHAAARIDWQPETQALRVRAAAAAPLAAGWFGLARLAEAAATGLRRAADGLAALARNAAASAMRAQGCIRAAESIASSGALK